MKLVDDTGFLLGIFSLSPHHERLLRANGNINFYQDLPHRKIYDLKPADANETIRVWTLIEAEPDGDSYTLVGFTVEEFERQRAVSFSPSLAYVKKLISDFQC